MNRKTEFILTNVSGQSKVKDGKGNEAIFSLNRPHTGVYYLKWFGRICMILVMSRYCYVRPVSIMTQKNI